MKKIIFTLIIIFASIRLFAFDVPVGTYYFDNSQTGWSNVYLFVGHGTYIRSYKMSSSGNAPDVFSVNLGSTWEGATGFYFANNSGGVTSGSSSYSINTAIGSLLNNQPTVKSITWGSAPTANDAFVPYSNDADFGMTKVGSNANLTGPSNVITGTNVMFYINQSHGGTLGVTNNSSSTCIGTDQNTQFNSNTDNFVEMTSSNVPGALSVTNNCGRWIGTGGFTSQTAANAAGARYVTGGENIKKNATPVTTSASATTITTGTASITMTASHANNPKSSYERSLYVQYYIGSTYYTSSAKLSSTSTAVTLNTSDLGVGTYTIRSVITDRLIYYKTDDITLTVTSPALSISSTSSSLTTSSTTQTYKGATITINGSGLGSVNSVKIGGSGGTACTNVTVVSATQVTAVVPDGTANGTIYVSDGTNNATSSNSFSNLGFISTATGNWATAGTWLGGAAPGTTDKATLANGHTVTLAADATIAQLTINSGATYSGSSNKLTLGANGTLTNNGTFTAGTGTIEYAGAGTVTGTIAFNNVTLGGALTNPTTVTVNGTLQLNSGASVSTAPTYGSASTLIYNTGGIYNRSVEWSANATSGAGYPNNIVLKGNGTQLRMGASKDYKYNASGALTIEKGATFDTRIGTPATTLGDVAITFIGDITNNGTIQWGSGGNMAIKCASLINNGTINMYNLAGGADFQLTGSLTNNATINYNGRAILFVGNGNTQTIGGTSADPFEIPFIMLNNPNGTLVLNKSIVAKGYSTSGAGDWAIDIQNGILDLNGHSITVGVADKIGNIRTATDGKIKGNVGSNITIYGKKNGTANGTLRIDNSNPGSSNVFNSFVYERTDGDNNFVITGNMTIGNLLDIKRGSVQALNNVDLLAGATGRLSSINESSALTATNLILGKSSAANAQFYRNGTLTVGNKVKVKVSFDQTGKWHFIAFPFAISAVEKSDGTPAVLGTDYTLGQYNATKRAQRISGWESSTDNPMTALKGYIINRRNTGPDNKDLYFVTNEAGGHAAFGASNNLPLSYTTHTGGLNVNFGWNFVAHPLVANGQSTLATGEFHYGYDGYSDQYAVGYGNSGTRRSFDAYFIKTATSNTLAVNLSAPQGAPRRTAIEGGTYQLALQHNNMQYRSDIRLHEAATFAYDELYDAPYSTPWNATTARFYSFAGNETMALNTVNGEGEIQLGARFPIKGSYKISWTGNMPGYIAQLVDLSNGELTDMRYNYDYSFEANAGDINNRFKVVLSSDVSTNNKIYINNLLYVNARSNTLHIEGTQQGDRIKLYDSTGREIHQQTATNNAIAIGNLPKGIYIINIEQNEGIWRRKVVMQ